MRVTVFGSSSHKTKQRYIDSSFELGQLLADRKHICVNGGGGGGAMGGVNRGCRSKNGEIVGVIHSQFCVDTDEDKEIKNMIVCKGNDLTERKQLLLDNGDCLIIMPGGVGTFDEFWDCVSHKSLRMKNLNDKPIAVVNVDGYWDGFVMQLKRAFDDGLLYGSLESYFYVANTPAEALDYCEREVSKKANAKADIAIPVSETNASANSRFADRSVKFPADDNKAVSASNSTLTSQVIVAVSALSVGLLVGLSASKL
jgi:uncharacterized protein (TIGR00730 family)